MDNTHPANILTAVGFTAAGSVGLIGNIILITVLWKGFKTSQPYEKIILATLLTDLFMCFNIGCLQPYAIFYHLTTLCKTTGVFLSFSVNMNEIWIAFNMFSRYIALYHPAKYHQWFNTHGILFCYSFATIINVLIFTPLVYYDTFGLSNLGLCGIATPKNTITTICGLSNSTFSFVSNVICSVLGYLVIKKMRGHISQVGSSLNSLLMQESRQIVILFAILAIIPILIQTPGIIIKLTQFFTTVNPWYSRAATSIIPLVPASAPFVTAYIIKPYRKKVVELFSRCGKSTTTNVVRINIVNR